MNGLNIKDTVSVKYSSKELVPMFGGSKVLVSYYVETFTDGVKNRYVVTCNIRGIECGSPEMEVCKVEAWDNNRETLIAEAVADKCEFLWDGICETQLRDTSEKEYADSQKIAKQSFC